MGATIVFVDYNNEEELTKACGASAVVVSALSGVSDVIVDARSNPKKNYRRLAGEQVGKHTV